MPSVLVSAADVQQCSATSFFHKRQAYTSGIVFKRGDNVHKPSYGHFWDGIDEDGTKNIGLKDFQFGYSKDVKGYRWGNITLPGYVGGARGFLLGVQMAMGSATGLLNPKVEKALYEAAVQGNCPDGWQDIDGLPNLLAPSGSSMRSGVLAVWNSTLLRAVQISNDEEEDDGTVLKREDMYEWNKENRRLTSERGSA